MRYLYNDDSMCDDVFVIFESVLVIVEGAIVYAYGYFLSAQVSLCCLEFALFRFLPEFLLDSLEFHFLPPVLLPSGFCLFRKER